ncbi:MAG: DUF4381 domain-containing protein [Desulfuromonadales bacterium]|nr:DUF4381 domain-containing protein [Desulfuromonadales bacterium]
MSQGNAFNPAQLLLRDIHLPAPVSWWPPAPGWWLLLTLTLTLAALGLLLHKRWRRRHYRRLLLAQLQMLEQQYRSHQDSRQLLTEVSALLRQAALLHFPDDNCAGLTGQKWLAFLDGKCAGEDFANGAGRVLALGPYQAQMPMLEEDKLFELCRRYLKALPPTAVVIQQQRRRA